MAAPNPFYCTYCLVYVRAGAHGNEYPYTLTDRVWAQLHGGTYVDDNLCITCANAKSMEHRGKLLSHLDFNPAGYGYENQRVEIGPWVNSLHPECRAALLRGSSAHKA
jgi:hypothetical protein